MSESKNKVQLTTTHKILLGGFCTIIVVTVVLACVLANVILRKEEQKETMNIGQSVSTVAQSNRSDLIVDSDAVAEMKQEMQQKVDEGMFRINMNTSWNFPNGESPSTNAVLRNSTSNNSSVYVEVMLEDGNEVVYTSPVIPVGSELVELTLDKKLDAGVYTAVCMYHLLDEEYNEKSTMGVNVTINVIE